MEVNVLENGPIIVVTKENEKIALCRCGHSENNQFCDGQHIKNDFVCPGMVIIDDSESQSPE